MTICTLRQTAKAVIDHLLKIGKKERTLYTYRKDLDLIEDFFEGDLQLTDLRISQVGKCYKSDALHILPNGEECAERTVTKTMRVFRMMVVWAKATGRIDALLLTNSTPMGHSQVKDASDE